LFVILTDMSSRKSLILASGSPRRKRILEQAGYRFEVIRPDIEEPDLQHPGILPSDLAQALAFFKARQVADNCGTGKVVLAADTVVAIGSEIFAKAEDAEQARQFLKTLSHNRHKVITAVALVDTDTGKRSIDFDSTIVEMRPMSDQEIEQYISTGAWKDKAGAYALQEGADEFVIQIKGSYTNVVGLPLELTLCLLETFGIHPHSATLRPQNGGADDEPSP